MGLDLLQPSLTLGAFDVTRQLVFNGAVTGVTYGLLAVGLVLIFRSTRVINVAHGEMGAFGAALLAMLAIKWEVNFFVALATALLVGALLGGAVELLVVRRLGKAPKVILFVATLGAAQLLFLLTLLLPDLGTNARYPTPFTWRWTVGGVLVRSEHFLVLILVPLLTGALAYFLERTKYGIAMRASAENPDAARTATINVKNLSTAVWVLAGLLATITAVMVAPLRGGTAVDAAALGPSLLLRALTAALIGRMRSLPLAIFGGLVIGIGEALLIFNYFSEPGIVDVVLFGIVLAAVLFGARGEGESDRAQPMSFSPRVRQIPAKLQSLWWVRRMPQLAAVLALVIAVVLPLVVTRPSRHFLFAEMLLLAIVGLSLTLLTGWAGQLSLGQFAFVGIGAMLTTAFVRGLHAEWFGRSLDIPQVSFELALVLSASVCVVLAVLVGLPALRVRGLFLAVTTLAFAVMTEGWLLDRPFLAGESTLVSLPRAQWGDGFSLVSQRTYYYVCLGVLALCLVLMSRLRRSGVGRSLIAVRDNEQNAAAFTISATRMKLTAFGVSGALAGLAGGLLAGLRINFGPEAFPPEDSLRVVAIAVIGGLASVWGAVLGALWVMGLPAIFGDAEEVRLLSSGAGLLILLLYLPGGLVHLVYSARDAALDAVARRLPDVEPAERATPIPASVSPDSRPDTNGADALVVSGVSVRFGASTAVDDVDMTVTGGEVVGLIGTNGAGKSTLMNAVGGFVPSDGSVSLFGTEATSLAPHRRARLGLGRTFQQADLFPDLSVRETVQVSLEARRRSHLIPALIGSPGARRAERATRSEADELIAFFGLGRYADVFINELSTGTRRIVELACLIGLEARLLCLDEPTAGVAQRETEAFAPLILRIREELGASLLVIEHDMPFIMGISDRVYCLEAGAVIASGGPEEVRNDPKVIASYLGTDERAIARSDTT